MKTRLVISMLALLLLPLAGIFLSGTHWSELSINTQAEDGSIPATLRTSIMLLVYVLLLSHIVKRLSSKIQHLARLGIASALTCWLLSYLNLFVASWTVPQNHTIILQLLLYTPLFAMLAPAVLVTSDLFSCFPAIANPLNFSLHDANRKMLLRILIIVTILGLAGGAAWPEQLFWLFWIAPLALLTIIQWHSSVLQSGSAVVGTALSGIFIGNIAVISYQSNAYLQINLPNMMMAQAGLALFGLLCWQLNKLVDNSEPFAVRKK